MHPFYVTKRAMNQSEIITFHGGPATLVEARDLDLLAFTLDGARSVGGSVASYMPEGDLVVNVVGLPDVGSVSGWVLLLG